MCSAILMNEKVDSHGGKLLSLFIRGVGLAAGGPKGRLEKKKKTTRQRYLIKYTALEKFNYVYSMYGIHYMLAQHCKFDL